MKPLTWEYLKQFNILNPPQQQIGRDPKVEESYQKHLTNLKQKQIKVHDYIYRNIFTQNQSLVFSPNTFPYNLEHGVQHWLLWLKPECQLEIDDISDKIEKRFGNDCVYFKNATKYQSIKSITHYHIFFRNNKL